MVPLTWAVMGHKEPMTIAAALRLVQKHELVIPAIQREFVWKAPQVVKVFDSIMRGYPVGSFLSWRVEPENLATFKFYGFLKDYSAFDQRHNPVVDIPNDQPRVAVLDGQQRLTSLNIGLRGSYAYKTKNAWSNKVSSYPIRRLYLNLLADASDNDAGLKYDLRFLTAEQLEDTASDPAKVWFPVSDIFEAAEPFQMMQLPVKFGVGNDAKAVEMISVLWEAVHHNASLHFYEESDQDIERVLDIFVRVNSGGTVLSYSDLLMSIATAQWKTKDARAEVHELVDALNTVGNGFEFSQDTVLKAGLVLSDIRDIGFKVKNFGAPNMALLEHNWDGIGASLKLAAGLLSDFGLSGGLLTADSVLIPVAYYVHLRHLTDAYRHSDRADDRHDRLAVRSWVLRSLIVRGVWGSGLDTLLRDIREVLRREGASAFPLAEVEYVMALRGKSLAVTDELIEDVLRLSYGGGRTWAVLAILFDHVDTQQQYHVDHVFPRALLDPKLLRAVRAEDGSPRYDDRFVDELINVRDLLPNLELLPGMVNIGKSDTAPDVWVSTRYPGDDERAAFVKANSLPTPLPHTVDDFPAYFMARRQLLIERIRDKLRTRPGGVPAELSVVPTAADGIEDALAEAESGE